MFRCPRSAARRRQDGGPVRCGRRLRSLRTALSISLLALASLSSGCDSADRAPQEPVAAERATIDAPTSSSASDVGPYFVDISEAVGVVFEHYNGMFGEYVLPEITGSGVALLDYDRDGDLDLYLVQGAHLFGRTVADGARVPSPASLPLSDRLYRNELVPTGSLTFVDVTEESGLHANGYGMGVAVADFDRDGASDLYISNYGPNQLWRNRGDGTFEDVTAQAGVGDPSWSTSCAFFDGDGDGDLDLFVVNYVNASEGNIRPCFRDTGIRDYCGPLTFEPVPDRLYRNDGEGRFTDISVRSGIGTAYGSGLGIGVADFDGDHRLDVFVANDGRPNQLWMNAGDGAFREVGVRSGVAVNLFGAPEASMGVEIADFDGDADLDLFMTHLTGETNTLYRNDGAGLFDDTTRSMGLAAESLRYTGFGTGAVDADGDGWLDLIVANGKVLVDEAQRRAGIELPLRQRNQLFLWRAGRFGDVSERAGPAFSREEVGRGLAYGDLDNDGDSDVVISNNLGPARVLENRGADGKSWIGFDVFDPSGTYRLLGALVRVETSAGGTHLRRVRREASYLSSHDPRVLVSLGAGTLRRVVVEYPSGEREAWEELSPGGYHELRRGTGEAVEKR